jgi:hypothetical protein
MLEAPSETNVTFEEAGETKTNKQTHTHTSAGITKRNE